jgi:hypothetical protein
MENSATIRLSSYLYFFKARSTFKIFLGSSNVIPFAGSGLVGYALGHYIVISIAAC